MADKEWEHHHAPTQHHPHRPSQHTTTTTTKHNNKSTPSQPRDPIAVPSHLYTDENPATTIKGTGFKDRRTAERTIHLTSQPGVRYKQYWTIRTNRERAIHHPYQTPGMRDAIEVFDNWLGRYQPPSPEERREMEEEWNRHRWLCASVANGHGYGKEPTKWELQRAREDVRQGKECLVRCLERCRRQRRRRRIGGMVEEDSLGCEVPFPLVAFTALFGGPGIHGYGKHVLDNSAQTASVVIEGSEGLLEMLPKQKLILDLSRKPKVVKVYHYREREMARAEIEYHHKPVTTLDSIWSKSHGTISSSPTKPITTIGKEEKHDHPITQRESWTCTICTYVHTGESKRLFLTCELCGAPSHRLCTSSTNTNTNTALPSLLTNSSTVRSTPNLLLLLQRSSLKRPIPTSHPVVASPNETQRSSTAAWGSLRPPSSNDIRGPRKRIKALEPQPPILEYVIVLDFEWTADDKRKMKPVAEITQFPSVVMKIVDIANHHGALSSQTNTEFTSLSLPPIVVGCGGNHGTSNHCLPPDLTSVMVHGTTARAVPSRDAYAVSMFDTFVRPTLNPTLTRFSIDLTSITQEQVDTAPTIDKALERYTRWLRDDLHLIDKDGKRIGNWCFATWGDADIATTLRLELAYKSVPLPPCFDRWINLKDDAVFRRHYGREPRGGLRFCVESVVGAKWEGRAHNGLVDSLNTAKIVRDMVRGGFRFTRATWGLDGDGIPFGSRHLPSR